MFLEDLLVLSRYSFLFLFRCFIILGCAGSSLSGKLFSSCGELGLLFIAVRRLLIAVASLVVEHGL